MFQHLRELNISYLSHWFRSIKFALWAAKMYFVCILHATFPCIFTDTFSTSVLELAKALEEEKNAKH
jgi:hypothetical protein